MPPQQPKWRGRRIVLLTGLALVLLVGAAGAAFVLTREGDVSNPDVEFAADPTATATPEVEPEAPAGERPTDPVDRFIWAHYGYTRDRRRFLPLERPLRPPFRETWRFQAHVLLEFPPVIGGKRLYILHDKGRLFALDKRTGRPRWQRKLGALAAASPAYANGMVYVVLLQQGESGRGARIGRVVALNGRTGRIRWSRDLASRSESSPLIDNGVLYFGAENGTVYAMDAASGRVRWKYRAGGAVKGGLALSDGKLYFGAYDGRVYAIRQRDGALLWRTGTSGGTLGLSSGNFYSTPAVAYGRVYIGNTDGRIYSFSARDGDLAWSRSTGGYVYASPAVAEVPGGRPTVYAGSYSGRFYALDARTGAVRWVRGGNGKISGGATVIGDIVYYADLGKRRTIGLSARTGRPVFGHERGSYNPVVSDGETIFLTGYHALYALSPLSAQQKQRRARVARTRAQRLKAERRACARVARRARDNRRSIRRSIERCLERKRARRRAKARGECRRAAERAHQGREKRVARSYRRCVARRHAQRR